MGSNKKKESGGEINLTKKEVKKIRKMRALITFHEARGGNRPGKVGDKRGCWSENPDYDQVCLLKEQIEEIHVNAQKRSWGHEGAKKEMGTRYIRDAGIEKKKAEEKAAQEIPAGSPVSVFGLDGFDAAPPLVL